MTATFYKYAFMAAIAAALLFSGFTWHKAQVEIAVNAAEQRVEKEFRVSMDEQRKRLTAVATKAEADLKVALAKNTQRKNDEVKAIKSRTTAVAASVRDAVETGNTSGSSIPNNTGSDRSAESSFDLRLSGFDAAVLTEWFAGSAAELQAELKSCQSDFDTIKEKLNAFKEANSK